MYFPIIYSILINDSEMLGLLGGIFSLVMVMELIFCHNQSKLENPIAAGSKRVPVHKRHAAKHNVSPLQSGVQYYLGACACAFCVRRITKLLLTIFFLEHFDTG